MSFEKILDQSAVVRALQSSIEKDRVAHAYMFVGPTGVGRKLMAGAFAGALNCESFANGNPCGHCANCRLIEAQKHPDVQTVVPIKRSSTITVEQIEDLLPFAHMRPVSGKFKVFIISEADRLGLASANKLLKTLEEPPPRTVFILVTDKPESVLPTVMSRCQPIKFGRLSAESVARILVSDFHVDQERAAVAAELAGGQVTRGLEFSDPERMEAVLAVVGSLGSLSDRIKASELLQGFFSEHRERLQNEAEERISGSGEELTQAMKSSIEDMRKSYVDRSYREFLNDCLGLLLTFYRDVFVLKETDSEDLVINRNRMQTVRRQAKMLNREAITQNMREIEEASEYCSHYVGEDRVFTDLLLRLRTD